MPGYSELNEMKSGVGSVMGARILVARVWHESNGFNPQMTMQDDFQIRVEKQLFGLTSTGSTLSGIIAQLQHRGAHVIPSISVVAAPGGFVDHTFYEQIKARIIADIKLHKPDAIALELHGAMATDRLDDAEGDLLQGLRATTAVPIGIGLDLHAHVSVAMLEAVDLCIACKENPHSDVVECGHRVADYLLAVLDGSLKPVNTLAKVPMILPGAGETASGPLFDIHEEARRLVKGDDAIWDISIFNVFRYADDVDIGQAAVVLTHQSASSGQVAGPIAQTFWSERHRFEDDLLTIDEALSRVEESSDCRPFVLADMGDRVLAGAPGDSTTILQAALEYGNSLRGALPVTDRDSVEAAWAAGIDQWVDLELGGKITPGFCPLSVRGKVIHLSDGNFVLAGPFQGGEKSSLGASATILIDDRIKVVVSSKPAFSHDPAAFTSQGVDLDALDFIVVKSGYHFKLNFAGRATPLLVRTPGVGYYTKGANAHRNARFWPEHAIAGPKLSTRVFGPKRNY
jgi:microcystin degradation protein MlrC